MTKQEQREQNLSAGIGFDLAYFEYTANPNRAKIKRLRTCNAFVIETENAYLLKSYNTLIAALSKHTLELYDVLRREYGYTATSAQHIAKFARDYGARVKYTFRFTA